MPGINDLREDLVCLMVSEGTQQLIRQGVVEFMAGGISYGGLYN